MVKEIKNFHIHLYFNEQSLSIAKKVAEAVASEFPRVEVGRFHEGPVGPHPIGSVQLLIDNENFGPVLSFVALNHKGLTIFAHPNTGDDLLDHTEHAIWLGTQMSLNLDLFKK